jgi:ATP-dependent DNA helicase RecG
VGKTVGKTVVIILESIKDNPNINREELSQVTGLSIRGVEWNLAKLKEEGKIRRIGPAKGGHWEVVDEFNDEKR